MASLRRTPCVGICSTTYGDLVCRGCKRFAHEIVQWNGFAEEQQKLVWQRLYTLLDGSVSSYLKITDEACLRRLAGELKVPEADTLSLESLAFEVLRRSTRRNQSLDSMGLEAIEPSSANEPGEPTDSPTAVLAVIEREFYQRSVARYERDFRTSAK